MRSTSLYTIIVHKGSECVEYTNTSWRPSPADSSVTEQPLWRTLAGAPLSTRQPRQRTRWQATLAALRTGRDTPRSETHRIRRSSAGHTPDQTELRRPHTGSDGAPPATHRIRRSSAGHTPDQTKLRRRLDRDNWTRSATVENRDPETLPRISQVFVFVSVR